MKPLAPPNEGQLQFADGETMVQRDSLGSKGTSFGPAEWEIVSPTQKLLLRFSASSPVLLALLRPQ